MSNIPPIDLAAVMIPESAIAALPAQLARRHTCVPIHYAAGTLVVAMADPHDIFAIDDMKFVTGHVIEVVVASQGSITASLDLHYGSMR